MKRFFGWKELRLKKLQKCIVDFLSYFLCFDGMIDLTYQWLLVEHLCYCVIWKFLYIVCFIDLKVVYYRPRYSRV